MVIDSVRTRKLNLRMLASMGGMPSSHTAMVIGLTTVMAKTYGIYSYPFAISLIFSLVVMYDAAGVRRAAGRQAAVLNRLIEDVFAHQGIKEERLRELIGHTPVEVLAGAALGVIVGLWPYR